VPLDEFGAGARPLPSRDEGVKVRFALVLVRRDADLITAGRRVLPDVAPALAAIRRREPLVEVANPMLRVRSGLLRSSRHDG